MACVLCRPTPAADAERSAGKPVRPLPTAPAGLAASPPPPSQRAGAGGHPGRRAAGPAAQPSQPALHRGGAAPLPGRAAREGGLLCQRRLLPACRLAVGASRLAACPSLPPRPPYCSLSLDETQVAVFDTEFHQSMPPEAYTYALPTQLARQHGIRRYGGRGQGLWVGAGPPGQARGARRGQACGGRRRLCMGGPWASHQQGSAILVSGPSLCRLPRHFLQLSRARGCSHAGQAAGRDQPDPVPPG